MSRLNIQLDPDFSRLRKTLLLEGIPDRLPLLDFIVHESIMQWTLERTFDTAAFQAGNKVYKTVGTPKDQMDFWVAAGYDYAHVRPFYDFHPEALYVKDRTVNPENIGAIDSFATLRSQEWPWQRPQEFCYDFLEQMAELLPKNMKIILSTGDIFTHVWELMGFVNFCNMLYEEPEFIAEMFRQFGEALVTLNRRSVEVLGDSLGAIWYTDDLAFNSGPFVNPSFYRQYLYPYVQQISDMAKAKNVPFLYHTDGALWSLFSDLDKLGVHGIGEMEPQSMDIAMVKKEWGHRFALIGGIEIDTLSRGSYQECFDLSCDIMKKAGYNGGYCVGSSNTLAHYVNPENFKAMIDAAFTHGRFNSAGKLSI